MESKEDFKLFLIGNSMANLQINEAKLFLELLEDSVDVIVTDPPYGTNYQSNRQSVDRINSIKTRMDISVREKYFSKIQGDQCLPTSWLVNAYSSLRNGGAIYIFSNWQTYPLLDSQVRSVGFNVKNLIVINKSNHGMGDLKGQYAPKHELLLFAAKGKHQLNFLEGRQNDVWDMPVMFSGARRLHPNQKPVEWYRRPIRNSCPPNGVVCDPFMGSCTCGEAALLESVNFNGCDIDDNFFMVSCERIESLKLQREKVRLNSSPSLEISDI